MFNRSNQPNTRTQILFIRFDPIIPIQIQIEEINIEFTRRSQSREEDVSSFRGPVNVVRSLVVKVFYTHSKMLGLVS